MPETALERYLRLAREIRKEAQIVSRPEDKRTLEEMAARYERLAAAEEAKGQAQAKEEPPAD